MEGVEPLPCEGLHLRKGARLKGNKAPSLRDAFFGCRFDLEQGDGGEEE